MTKDELPVGFAMALAMNPDSMQKFVAPSEEEKRKIIAGIHSVKNRDEMHRYVNDLISNKKTDTNA